MDLRRGSHKEQLFLEKQRFTTPGGRNSGGNPDKPQGHTRARTALSPDGTRVIRQMVLITLEWQVVCQSESILSN